MRIVDYMTNFTFNEKAIVPVNGDQLDEVSKGAFYNPHEILGAHLGSPDFPDTCTIRVLRPAERLEDGVRTDTDITIAYFSEHFKNGVPSIYREPQGRITVIK